MATSSEKLLVKIAYEVLVRKEKGLFHALALNYCNGGLNEEHAEICDAVVGFGLRTPVPLCMWYFCLIETIFDDALTSELKVTFNAMTEIVSLMKNQHEKCLKQLLEEEGLTEEKIKGILAIHYFQPLSQQGAFCYVDKCQGFKKCQICGKDVKADFNKTSFGNSLVWHGQADILIESTNIVNMVKVSQEEKVVKKDVEHVEEEDMAELHDQDSDQEEMDECSNIVEIETEFTNGKARSHSQAIAQTIVNAFVENIRDESLFDKYIPSFFATNKIIRIILYNCKLDKLLFSEELPIFNDDGDLEFMTMIFLWTELNNLRKMKENVQESLEHFIPECRFKDAVGDAYDIYLKQVSRPCNKEMKLDSHKEDFNNILCDFGEEAVKIREAYFSLWFKGNKAMAKFSKMS